MASLPGESARAHTIAPLGLGTVEAEVARLAAEGYPVLSIAARLGVAESTVRTNLRRAYVKLGIHGRDRLASVMLQGIRPEPGTVRRARASRAATND